MLIGIKMKIFKVILKNSTDPFLFQAPHLFEAQV